jgi:hypothetical protein
MPAIGCRVFAIHAYTNVVRGKNRNPSKGNIVGNEARMENTISMEDLKAKLDARRIVKAPGV